MKYDLVNSDKITPAELTSILGTTVNTIERGGIIVGYDGDIPIIKPGVSVDVDGTLDSNQVYILNLIFAKQKYNADKIADILEKFPDWDSVKTIFDDLETATEAISSMAEAKVVLIDLITTCKKVTKVVYWLAKNSDE